MLHLPKLISLIQPFFPGRHTAQKLNVLVGTGWLPVNFNLFCLNRDFLFGIMQLLLYFLIVWDV